MKLNKKNIVSIIISTLLFSSLNITFAAENVNTNEEKVISDDKAINENTNTNKTDENKIIDNTAKAKRFYFSDNIKDKEAAFNFFLNNAGRDVESLYYMGLITYNGEFTISKDESLGLGMIESASKAGYKTASLFLAKKKIESDSVEKKQEGLQLLLNPKYQNDGDILYYLGKLYDEGKYVPKNDYYAERYYQQAALNRNDDAAYKIGSLYIKSEDEDKQKFGWTMIAKAALNKNADACYIMADKVKEKALSQNKGINIYIGYLKCAANGGYPDSAKEYAYYLVTGNYVKYDSQEAYKYYKIYLENNKEPVAFDTYFQIGVLSVETNNKASAKENLEKASQSGITNASYYMAKLYENGYWNGEPDFAKAKEYYELSEKQGRNNVNIDLKRIEDKINLITSNK